MKNLYILLTLIFLSVLYTQAQVEQYDPDCSTPDLDSATAVALPYYDNNQILETYLSEHGYNSLPYINLPGPQTRAATFLQPKFLVPINVYIYRNGANDINSSVTEAEASNYVCLANEIYRASGAAIEFYLNRVEFEANEFFNNQVSSSLHVYDLWSRKRYIPDPSQGINVHFIRYNNQPEDNAGKASLPHYIVPPYANYSLYVRTHNIPSGGQRSDTEIASTLAHEIGHTLGLLHTHHPGRLLSLTFNEQNATISNGCLQEAVSRSKSNYWYDGCLTTNNKKKCEINGDFLCDTEADPRQTGRVSSCNYVYPVSGDYREDNWGDLWTPPTRNIMSYTTSGCRSEFSRGQIAIMWMQMEHFQNFINYQEPIISTSSSSVCSGSGKSFTLAGTLPIDAFVQWEVQPASLVTTANGTGTTATLSAASGAKGNGKIIFTLTGASNCYIAQLQDTFWVGLPNDPTPLNVLTGSFNNMCVGSYVQVSISPIPGAEYYSWISNDPSGLDVSGSMLGALIAGLQPSTSSPNGYWSFSYGAGNACGNNIGMFGVIINNCGGGGDPDPIPIVYPNPTTSSLAVRLTELPTESFAKRIKDETPVTYQIYLYDKSSTAVYSTESKSKEIIIPLENVAAGNYYLQVHANKELILQEQIIIRK